MSRLISDGFSPQSAEVDNYTPGHTIIKPVAPGDSNSVSLDSRITAKGLNDITNAEVVALDVLEKFGIPYTNETVIGISRGVIKGFDIRNMDPFQAIRFSLSEAFLDKKLIEVFINESGVAEFIEVGGPVEFEPSNNAFPIFRSASATHNLRGDLVVVRGFDKPPRRFMPDGRRFNFIDPPGAPDGPRVVQAIDVENPSNIDEDLVEGVTIGNSRLSSKLNRKSSVVYYEPALDSNYKDAITRSYNPRCFESLITWRYEIDWNVVQSLDIDAQVEFNNSALLANQIDPISIDAAENPRRFRLDTAGINRDLLVRENFYGEPVSTFLGIESVFIYGFSVNNILQTIEGNFALKKETSPVIIQLNHGSDFEWFYGQEDDNLTSIAGNTIPDIFIKIHLSDSIANTFPVGGFNTLGANWLPVGDGLGYLVSGLWANISLNLPSINVFSPGEKAVEIGEAIITNNFMQITPVVIFDPPAPVYYRFRNEPTQFDKLSLQGFIDHEQDIVDADPSTIQELDDTPSKQLQDAAAGYTVDVSFPFVGDGRVTAGSPSSICPGLEPDQESQLDSGANESEIVSTRDFIFELFNNEDAAGDRFVDTNGQYVFSGNSIAADNLPKLGQIYTDPDGKRGIINTINYSYQDGSSMQLTVNTGHRVTNIGSWGTQIYRRASESVSREGTVIQVGGNSSVFVVKIFKLGVYSAISSIKDEIEVGDRVNVTVYNNPTEG